MVDPSMSSFSSGGSGPVPENKQKATPKKQQGATQDQQVSSGTSDTMSNREQTTEQIFYGQSPSIMQFMMAVDSSKQNLKQTLSESTIANYLFAKLQHLAMGSLANVTVDDMSSIDDLSDQIDDLYQEEINAIDKMNKAIGTLNSAAKKAATNMEVDGTTLADATKSMNKQIEAYNNGDITEDQLQSDWDQYTGYLNDWTDAVKTSVTDKYPDLQEQVTKYATDLQNFNDQVEEINLQLEAYGCTYRMTPLPTVSDPISISIPDKPPSQPITAPKPISPIEKPPEPPTDQELHDQMTQAPQQLYSDTASVTSTMQHLQLSDENSQYTASLLKKLNKQLPFELEIMPVESHYQKFGDVQRTASPIVKDLFLKLNLSMMASDEAKKMINSDAFIGQMDMMTKQVYSEAVLTAISTTHDMLSNQNPSAKTVDTVFGINLANELKRSVSSGKLQSLTEILVNSHDATMNMPQDEKQKLYDMMNLNMLLTIPNVISSPFNFKGMGEQLFAHGIENYDRTPTSINQLLPNSLAKVAMSSMTVNTLMNKYGYSVQDAEAVASAINKSIAQAPYQGFGDLRSSLFSNMKSAGIGNDALAGKLADDITRTMAEFMPLAPAVDKTVSPSFQLFSANQQLFDDSSKIDSALEAKNQDLKEPLRESILRHTNHGTRTSTKELQGAISSDLMSVGVSKQDSNDISKKYTDAVEADSQFAEVMKLTPASVEQLQNELEGRFDPTVASTLMQAFATNQSFIGDSEFNKTLKLAVEVSNRLDGGASSEQLERLGITNPAFIDAVMSVKSQPIDQQQAFVLSVQQMLSDRLMMGPNAAKEAAKKVSFDSVINVSPILSQLSSELENRGYTSKDASDALNKTLSIPEAYSSEKAFKNTLAAFLPRDVSVDQLDLSQMINDEKLSQQLGVDVSDRLLSTRSFRDEIGEQLTAITGMSPQQASAVMDELGDPANFFDTDKFGEELAELGFDNTVTEPILNNALYIGDAYISAGKFAEFVGNQLPKEVSVDLSQVLNEFVRRDVIERAILVGVESQGGSPEEAKAMASRGSTDLFKVKTPQGEMVWNN